MAIHQMIKHDTPYPQCIFLFSYDCLDYFKQNKTEWKETSPRYLLTSLLTKITEQIRKNVTDKSFIDIIFLFTHFVEH